MTAKKYIIISLIFLLILASCSKQEQTEESSSLELVILTQDGMFSQQECEKRELNDKVIMIKSKYCSHCKETMPIFQEACSEKGIEPIILDIVDDEQRIQMESYGISVAYTPTFIFGCKYYVGSKNKQQYLNMLDTFIKEIEK